MIFLSKSNLLKGKRFFRILFFVFVFCLGFCGEIHSEKNLNDSIVYSMLVQKGIKEPKIVLAQAKQETGNYRSRLCVNGNNLFGIRIGKRYAHFNTIEECIDAYKNKIQYRYREGKENYWSFLKRIGYAEDVTYISKVKKILKKIKI